MIPPPDLLGAVRYLLDVADARSYTGVPRSNAEWAALASLRAALAAVPEEDAGARFHVPQIAESRNGFGVFCAACSAEVGDYVFPCRLATAASDAYWSRMPASLIAPPPAQPMEPPPDTSWVTFDQVGVRSDPALMGNPEGDRRILRRALQLAAARRRPGVPFGGRFTDAELWDHYDNDPKTHELVRLLLSQLRWSARLERLRHRLRAWR